ncbi:hypothetical protein INR49_009146 [Caranx melampygus]|nr:hypothetical protein INR49_009146 [Caranx melampygus]
MTSDSWWEEERGWGKLVLNSLKPLPLRRADIIPDGGKDGGRRGEKADRIKMSKKTVSLRRLAGGRTGLLGRFLTSECRPSQRAVVMCSCASCSLFWEEN